MNAALGPRAEIDARLTLILNALGDIAKAHEASASAVIAGGS